MTNPIQLLRDFRKWRKEKYDEAFSEIVSKAAEKNACEYLSAVKNFRNGISYGIKHRKEILKQVKI